MCINDWRFGRLIRSATQAYNLGAGQTLTLGANPNRVGLTIMSTNISAAGTLLTVSMNGAFIFGVRDSDPPLHFTIATHGDLPTREFVLTRITGSCVGGVVEYLAPATYLAAGLQEFETLYGRFLQHV